MWASVSTRTHVGFESWLERDVAMQLDYDADVTGLASQPFQLSWHERPCPRRDRHWLASGLIEV
jgi:hypothetical protein